METLGSPPCSITDCHIHYAHPDLMPELIKLCDDVGVDRFNIVCTPHQQRMSLVPDALHLKSHYPERVFVFGGLDISIWFTAGERAGELFAQYVDTLIDLGCDGIKMIEGKPQMRKGLPILPFDSEVLEPYWGKVEQAQFPVLFHLNDPQEFWIKEEVPEWAVERGWFYGDGSFVHFETQYTEVLNVLSRHPDLKIIFAHFFFLSNDLPRLADYLDRYPNICIDLTPGIEMYLNFSKKPDETQAFFERFQDRILFGTDVGAKALLDSSGAGIDSEESRQRVYLIRRFLEQHEAFQLGGDSGFLFGDSEETILPLGLPNDILEKIYHLNFERFVSNQPRPLNNPAISRECERLIDTMAFMAAARNNQESDSSVAKHMAAFFKDKADQ
ncbi:MAG: amidohydrolase family protein [Pseudomonadales bacterium]|nr:amidohydrolase family protein [Pseudomonadales bacterium]